MRKFIIPLGLCLAGCSESPAPPQNFVMPPVPVFTAAVEKRDVPLYLEAMGTIKPSQVAEVIPQVTGLIIEVHFTEGDWIEEGTLLYTIDPAPYSIKVQEMEALLAQDLAHLSNAKKKLERFKTLSKQDLISKLEWDEMETKVALHRAMVKANKARLDAAKLDLEHCKVTAPISGRAGKTMLHAGNMAGSSPLVTLSRMDPLYVDFSLTENELQKLTQKDYAMEVYVSGKEEPIANGKVFFLDHCIDPKSGQLAARGALSQLRAPLFAGQSVRVHLFFGMKESAKLIPLKAVKTNQSGPYVFSVKEDGTVEMCAVKLGSEDKGYIVVEEGLDNASKVVTEGHLRLYPGSKVEEAPQ